MSYESIFERMSKKQQREFEKLPAEEKAQIFAVELQNKVNKSIEVEIPAAFYRGYLKAYEMLANNYVMPIANAKNSQEIADLIDSLLKDIERNYNLAIAEFEKLSKDEGEK